MNIQSGILLSDKHIRYFTGIKLLSVFAHDRKIYFVYSK